MDRKQLNILLDNVYELEGLIHLAIARDDCPDPIKTLIDKKIESVVSISQSLAPDQDNDNSGIVNFSIDQDYVMDDADVSDKEKTEWKPVNTEKTNAPVTDARGRLVFTINDRYRFKRDLFANSDAEFNTTLALVASMDNYEEAEDYFLGELQWNPQREEVVDFLNILKNYFR